ncbi:glycosyltransferase family 2 protein [Candidatus Uabimicrobium amorphum]|uniref:Glycosyl transferase n=1 Tax=Uabimicrobium amorphum TaxID=2596890 RepID=A0A5S9ILB6_UABAM|nr:glycosyltransferase [Candidatus Uabimicrobium amorphum]BBM83650.1 glycosyl transferase [Candidatus Uabimicrobium amorphum]
MKRISICVPTYNRKKLLKKALDSCLAQTHLPHEIIIGDDSTNLETKLMVKNLQQEVPNINIRYFKHSSNLGQHKNAMFLIQKVEGEYLLILHDDDELEKEALADYLRCFSKCDDIVAVYGKQYFIDEQNLPHGNSEDLNKLFFREKKYEGLQADSLKMAILQQFNGSFMVRTDIVTQINYNDLGAIGQDAIDFFFGLEMAKYGKFYFLNKYTAKYRVGNVSVSNNKKNNAGYNAFKYVFENFRGKQPEIEMWLTRKSNVAVMQAINLKDKKNAFKWYFSKYHKSKIFTPGGIKRLILLCTPNLKRN